MGNCHDRTETAPPKVSTQDGCGGSQGGGGGGVDTQGGGGGGGGQGGDGDQGGGDGGGGDQGGGGGGGVRDIYEWDEGGCGICRAGARGSRNVGTNHGPGWVGGGNAGAIYGSGAGGGGNVGSIYRDVEGREGNVAGIYEHGEGWDSNRRAGARLRNNIGAIYAPGARNTGGNIDEIFLRGPGSGGTVGGST